MTTFKKFLGATTENGMRKHSLLFILLKPEIVIPPKNGRN